MHIYSFNDLKFTLKHLKRSYMFRSYYHPQGGYIVPCQSYSLKTLSGLQHYVELVLWQHVLCTVWGIHFSEWAWLWMCIVWHTASDAIRRKRTSIARLILNSIRLTQYTRQAATKPTPHNDVNHWVFLNYNFSKEQCMLPEDDRMIETCRSVLSVLMWILDH